MKKTIIVHIILLFVGYSYLSAQDYEISFKQRRLRDHIAVEFWAKSLKEQNRQIGRLRLRLEYDQNFLEVRTNNFNLNRTDSISSDLNSDPFKTINSAFANRNGLSGVTVLETDNSAGIQIELENFGTGGVVPSREGRGSFVGRLTFRIRGNAGLNTSSGIKWSGVDGEESLVQDNLGDDVTEFVRFSSEGQIRLQGVTYLAPNSLNVVLNREKIKPGLDAIYRNIGYPIYFERSASPNLFNSPTDEDIAFLFEYNDGSAWKEIGRVVETNNRGQIQNNRFSSGNLGLPNSSSGNMITTAEELPINSSNYQQPLRVFWKVPDDLRERAESVRLRVSMLGGSKSENISNRPIVGQSSLSDFEYPMGSNFFVKLDGTREYLKSQRNFSNPTQITAEAWINPDRLSNNDISIVASSAGPGTPPINGKAEGAWTLYLKDGKFPAFKARGNSNQGENGNFIDIVSETPIKAGEYSDNSADHSKNWTHISASLTNNSAKLYVDGELVAESGEGKFPNEKLLTTNHPVWIEVNPNGGALSGYFSGSIKEVKVWRVGLTQDQIRFYSNGVNQPTNFEEIDLPDDRTGLDLYYKLNGDLIDIATKEPWQNGSNNLSFFGNSSSQEAIPSFLPDLPHLKITAPKSGAGISNSPKSQYEIRYIGYNVGNPTDIFTRDVNIEYSTNGGSSWFFARTEQGVDIGGQNGTAIETGEQTWVPYLNTQNGGNLRSPTPFTKNVLLRITGNTQFNQTVISSNLIPIKIARYLALEKNTDTKLELNDHGRTAIPKDGLFFSAWIRPFRFPTSEEGLFPVIARVDSINGDLQYKLSLNQNGSLVFESGSSNSKLKVDLNPKYKLEQPLEFSSDTLWSHLAFYFDPSGGRLIFFKDGFLANDFDLSDSTYAMPEENSNFKTYLGYEPQINDEEAKGFLGNIREMRFWDGIPLKIDINSSLKDLTEYVQSHQAIRINSLLGLDTTNLMTSFDFNGSMLTFNGLSKSIKSDLDSAIFIKYQGTTPNFDGSIPYLKLVEPRFGTEVRQDDESLKLRWIGFDYDGLNFRAGSNFVGPPSLEFSVEGGGGDEIAPYQYVGSPYWFGNTQNSLSFPDSTAYRFEFNNQDILFGGTLNVSQADPDIFDENSEPLEQGPIPIALNNARLRLTGTFEIEDLETEIKCESGLFSIIPGSNITIRVLMEGLHFGTSFEISQIDTSFEGGAPRLHIYKDNNGIPGEKLGETLPSSIYEDLNPFNRNSGNNRFANINYRFIDIEDGNYWLILEQKNHLAIMSRFAAPIKLEGDNKSTWIIESGWDFTSWNGLAENFLPNSETVPYSLGYYTAFGEANLDNESFEFFRTGLNFNAGANRNSTNAMPAMVAGDLNSDGQISVADAVEIRLNSATNNATSDITNDGIVNALDRIILDDNLGRVSSLGDFIGLIYSDESSSTISESVESSYSKFKNQFRLQTGESFVLSGIAEIIEDSIELELFIRSTGNTFTLGESSVPISFDTTSLEYIRYDRGSNPYFSNLPSETAPDLNNPYAIQDLRSIEIANFEPVVVPSEDTSLGRMIFSIKSEKLVYSFNWHQSLVVFSGEGRNITSSGIEEEISPALSFNAEFISPSGGEIFGTGETIEIEWINEGGDVWLEFASGENPNQSNWERVSETAFSSTISKAEFTLPFNSNEVNRFRLVEAETNLVLAMSNIFSVEPKFGQIVSPSNSSPVFTGGTEIDIWFSASGYKTVDFEFSSDAINWEPVLEDVDANLQNVRWILPRVTTALGYLRMVSEKGTEIDISDRFSILTGEIEFLKPQFNEPVQANQRYSIQWQYSDVETFTLQYSIDNGSNWQDIGEANAYFRSFNWNVGNLNTDVARVRAVIKSGLETFVLEESNIFRIGVFASLDTENLKFEILYPIVNLLQISSSINTKVKIDLYSLEGNLLESNTAMIKNGVNQLPIKSDRLKKGVYFLRLSNHEIEKTLKIIL